MHLARMQPGRELASLRQTKNASIFLSQARSYVFQVAIAMLMNKHVIFLEFSFENLERQGSRSTLFQYRPCSYRPLRLWLLIHCYRHTSTGIKIFRWCRILESAASSETCWTLSLPKKVFPVCMEHFIVSQSIS